MALALGQFSYNGLLMGPGTPFQWNTIDGLTSLSAVRTANVPRPQAQGMIAGYDFAGERTVTFNLEVVATAGSATMQQNLNIARAAFQPVTSLGGGVSMPSSTAFVWNLGEMDANYNGINRCITARCEKFDGPVDIGWIAQQGGIANIAVQMSAVDPIIYDAALQSVVLAANSAGTATQAGPAQCYPVVTILGPATDPAVTNSTTGQTLGFNLTIPSGQTLVIDMWAGTALLNGTTDELPNMTAGQTSFWGLPYGTSNVTYTASSATGSTATIQYRCAWI